MAIRNKDELKEWWSARLSSLVGRTITQVTYMSQSDVDRAGWGAAAVVIILDDGTSLSPMMDDEGNGPGALAIAFGTKVKGERVAPVI